MERQGRGAGEHSNAEHSSTIPVVLLAPQEPGAFPGLGMKQDLYRTLQRARALSGETT